MYYRLKPNFTVGSLGGSIGTDIAKCLCNEVSDVDSSALEKFTLIDYRNDIPGGWTSRSGSTISKADPYSGETITLTNATGGNEGSFTETKFQLAWNGTTTTISLKSVGAPLNNFYEAIGTGDVIHIYMDKWCTIVVPTKASFEMSTGNGFILLHGDAFFENDDLSTAYSLAFIGINGNGYGPSSGTKGPILDLSTGTISFSKISSPVQLYTAGTKIQALEESDIEYFFSDPNIVMGLDISYCATPGAGVESGGVQRVWPLESPVFFQPGKSSFGSSGTVATYNGIEYLALGYQASPSQPEEGVRVEIPLNTDDPDIIRPKFTFIHIPFA